jgi:hypothetical protein
VAGRILRAQAERQHAFERVAPLLSARFIRPKTQTHPAGEERKAIATAVTALRRDPDRDPEADDASFVALQNVIEHCCNYFLRHNRFPATYEELQPLPLLSIGLLSYAGDAGGEQGQAYRHALDLEAGAVRFRFHCADAQGAELQAPTLREVVARSGVRCAVFDLALSVRPAQPLPAWGDVERVLGVDWGAHTVLTATAVAAVAANEVEGKSEQVGRPFFLDTGGFDGRQARTRRQIDQLHKKIKHYEQQSNTLPEDHRKRAWYASRIQALLDEKSRCWGTYNARNRALAHLASNVILLLARVRGCSLVAMESLKTLKSTGRGKGMKGRWRQYRNNTTSRGEIWQLLEYKCALAGVRLRAVPPKDTSHTCPHCGQPAKTFRSPTDRSEVVDWGRWLWCGVCGYNAERDYCASLNIARLGVTPLTQMQAANTAKRYFVRDQVVKPVSYTGAGAGATVAPAGLPYPPASWGKDLLLSWLAQDRLPAIVALAADLSALVRLSRWDSGRFLQRWTYFLGKAHSLSPAGDWTGAHDRGEE